MNKKQQKITEVNKIIHGCDYNPEHWLHEPEIIDRDFELMQRAGINSVSIGIFSWALLEPAEGQFNFSWLDKIMDSIADNRMHAVLATPSGSRPRWLAAKYPEVLRVGPERTRNLYCTRHNHCPTSPIYREKSALIDSRLAERYKNHPALSLWHISNEFSGECFCPLCEEEFRTWLKEKYNNDLDLLNQQWWNAFWSHTYQSWEQIEAPGPDPKGEQYVHGLNLDWKRFCTDRIISFMQNEIQAVKKHTPHIPATTNLMGFFKGIDYWKLAPKLDIVSWDSYPPWHQDPPENKYHNASFTAFSHDLNRSLKKDKPFLLMECTVSNTNWMDTCKLKKPGMHRLSALQAVAHGADSIQYFQWRAGRGSSEKFHGAVMDHSGSADTRVFKEVAALGSDLAKLGTITGQTGCAETAVIVDWENWWAIDDCLALVRNRKNYLETCHQHYQALWQQGLTVDVINMDQALDSYRLVCAPMLYMLKPGAAERIIQFVHNGGTFITTYWSGMVNENDLCFTGGFPGPLAGTLGIRVEETESLLTDERKKIRLRKNKLGLKGETSARDIVSLINLQGAESLALFKDDFFRGRTALSLNQYGRGKACYLAFRPADGFLDNFYKKIRKNCGLKKNLNLKLPAGVNIQKRIKGGHPFYFILNFNNYPVKLKLKASYLDLLSGKSLKGKLSLGNYGAAVLTPRS
ncbi:MAG TPA: beta-galactosidase [Spirochaetota bacterium]|nr:beta-galactosidase [Spirochaetota bacterium]